MYLITVATSLQRVQKLFPRMGQDICSVSYRQLNFDLYSLHVTVVVLKCIIIRSVVAAIVKGPT